MERRFTQFTSKSGVKNNLKLAIELGLNNALYFKKDDGSTPVYKVTRVGRLLSGEAYYHEIDKHYNCIGLEIELEVQYDFQDEPTKDSGFFAIWAPKSIHPASPLTFEESNGELGNSFSFTNGCGDDIEVMKVLLSEEQVNKLIEYFKIDINNPPIL